MHPVPAESDTGVKSVTDMVTISPPQTLSPAPEIDSLVVDYVNSQYTFTYNAPASGVTYDLFDVGDGSIGAFNPLAQNITGTSKSVSFGPSHGGHFAILAYDSSAHTATLSNIIDADYANSPAVAWNPNGPDVTDTLLPDGTVQLAWDNNSYNEDHFEIQWSSVGGTDDADWHPVGWDSQTGEPTDPTLVDPDVTSYIDTTVKAGSTNWYRVRAVRSATVTANVLVDGTATQVSQPLDSDWAYSDDPPGPKITIDAITATMNEQDQYSTDTSLAITNDNCFAVVYSPSQTLALEVQGLAAR